ncbi:MAG: hypothetical protein WBK75_03620 [Acutalibacteraceae bacterium]|jgi:hypothetical protein|nr:hypothetical protein [Clostridiales bacterium]
MKIEGVTVSGQTICFSSPIQMELCESFDTPASSLFVVFCIFWPLEELEKIIVKNNGEVVFDGYVDEQSTICDSSGVKIKISARSNAPLIDNEALPVTYIRPSVEDIYKNHLEPFGIKGVLGSGICQGNFTVSKGTCHWAVVDEFCKCVLNVSPKITKDGYLDTRHNVPNETPIVFSNESKGNCRYFSAQVKYKRYGVIGQMLYKVDPSQGYTGLQIDENAKKRKITTKRYLNLSGSQKWERQYRLQREFKKSLSGSCEVELLVPFDCFLKVGALASFYDKRLGEYKDFRIFHIEHIISNLGMHCNVILRPKEHF